MQYLGGNRGQDFLIFNEQICKIKTMIRNNINETFVVIGLEWGTTYVQ